MEEKNLSIIIPVYNAEKYIKNILHKLDKQITDKIEVLLIDDGSKDESLEICESYVNSSNGFKVFHQQNSGASAARNRGIELAKGRYIVFIDSDDDIADDYIKTVCDLCDDTNADIIQLDSYMVKNGYEQYINLGLEEGAYDADEYCKFVLKQTTNPPWNKIYKDEIIKKNKICFDVNMVMGEDISFTLEFLRYVSSVYVCNCAIYKYMQNSDGLCSNVTEEYLSDLNVLYGKMENFIRNKKLEVDAYKIMNESMLRSIFRAVGLAIGNGSSRVVIKKIIKESNNFQNLLKYHYNKKIDNVRKYMLITSFYTLIARLVKYKNK